MHRWVRESRGIATLFIGAENRSFPIPLVSRNCMWRFDANAGSAEIRFRRIGENEMTAIEMCDVLATAKARPGTDGETDRLMETLLPYDASKPIVVHGYYLHILPNSSGFAALAYPAKYRSSEVLAFIATQDGVSEKDLGTREWNVFGGREEPQAA